MNWFHCPTTQWGRDNYSCLPMRLRSTREARVWTQAFCFPRGISSPRGHWPHYCWAEAACLLLYCTALPLTECFLMTNQTPSVPRERWVLSQLNLVVTTLSPSVSFSLALPSSPHASVTALFPRVSSRRSHHSTLQVTSQCHWPHWPPIFLPST